MDNIKNITTIRPKLNPKEFIDIWTGKLKENPAYSHFYKKVRVYNLPPSFTADIVSIEGYEITGNIIFPGIGMTLPHLFLKNSLVGNITLSDVKVKKIVISQVQYSNSSWNKANVNLNLINCEIDDLYISGTEKISIVCAKSQFNTIQLNTVGILKVSETTNVNDLKIESLGSLIVEKSSVNIVNLEAIRNPETGESESTIGKIEIKDSKVQKISIGYDCIVGDIHIEESTLDDFIAHRNSLGDVSIKSLKSEIKSVEFSSCNLGKFTISNTDISSIMAEEGTEIGYSVYSKTKVNKFRIENSEFSDMVFSESEIGTLDLSQSVIGDIHMNEGYMKKIFAHRTNISALKVFLTDVSLIMISEKSILRYFSCHLEYENRTQVILKDSSVQHLDLSEAVFPEFTYFNISDCHIQKISFDKFCNFGSMFFSNIIPQQQWTTYKREVTVKDEKREISYLEEPPYKIHNSPTFARRYGKHITQKEQLETIISMKDSDLGKTQFIGCNLSAFDCFEFVNSKILDVFIAGTLLPEKIAVSEGHNQLEQERLAFGQFKKIYENRGDTPMALRYLSLEMTAYYKLLQAEKKTMHYTISGNAESNKSELFILFLNRISNNFGTDWWLGFRMSIIATLFCFGIYLILAGISFEISVSILFCSFCMLGITISKNYEFRLLMTILLGLTFINLIQNNNNFRDFWDYLSYAPQYLNPLRDSDIDILKDKDIKSYARFWDYVSRIIVGYFVYQTIQAFRKLGKSSG